MSSYTTRVEGDLQVDAGQDPAQNGPGNISSAGGGVVLDENTLVPATPTAGKGIYWVKDTAPNLPFFTDDAGTDHNLLNAGGGTTETYAIIREEQPIATNGGTFTSGAWRTRTLNTISGNAGGDITIAANQITLQAGTYNIDAYAPAYRVENHQIRFQNITDGTTALVGTSDLADGPQQRTASHSHILGQITIASAKVFEIQHRCASTVLSVGFGVAAGFTTEVYTSVIITKSFG